VAFEGHFRFYKTVSLYLKNTAYNNNMRSRLQRSDDIREQLSYWPGRTVNDAERDLLAIVKFLVSYLWPNAGRVKVSGHRQNNVIVIIILFFSMNP